MDLSTLSDDELGAHLNAVLAEQERRASLRNVPAQVAQLAATYEAGGGSRADLIAAVGV
jgi:hypothetical protein